MDQTLDELKSENEALKARLAHYEIGEIPDLRSPSLDQRVVDDGMRTLMARVRRACGL